MLNRIKNSLSSFWKIGLRASREVDTFAFRSYKTLAFLCLCGVISIICFSCSSVHKSTEINDQPPIWPDYKGTTIPCNIAPMNFIVEDANKTCVTITGSSEEIIVKGDELVDIPIRKWQKLLANNSELSFVVEAKVDSGWIIYKPFSVFVSPDSIDSGICYRRIYPGYALYGKMGIYERELSNFNEYAVWENIVNGGCVNCHSFPKCDADKMQLHLRSENAGTIIKQGDKFDFMQTSTRLNKVSCTYPYWHPNGRFIAYSINNVQQNFHNTPDKMVEVFDSESEIAVYDTQRKTLLYYPLLRNDSVLNTFPAFSADGNTLYFCSAEKVDSIESLHYKLCSVDFNSETGEIGDKIKVLYADEKGSVAFPRPSYDGQYLMFSHSAYGTFFIWHKDADLYVLDLLSGEVRNIEELNSSDTESYHSWNSTSKWVVFSSRRDDGLHTRLYLSHLNVDGKFTKSFILPQKNPQYYNELLQSYNVPEFVTGEVELNTRKILSSKIEKVETRIVK